MFPKEKLHHAYLLLGDKSSIIPKLEKELSEKFGVIIHGNQDFFKKDYESLGIDETREIKELQNKKSVTEKSLKIFVISTHSITREAQNALLKVFEEPTESTHFFIVMPNSANLLQTLISRVEIVKNKFGEDRSAILPFDSKTFLKSSLSEKLKLLEKIIEEKEKNKLEALIDDLIYTLSSVPDAKKLSYSKTIQEILVLKKFLNFKSSSIKNIAEHLSFILQGISL